MGIAIRAEHVSKEYRLGVINHGMLYKDFQSWMAKRLGKPDPHGKIGDDRFQTRDDQFWALKDVTFEVKKGETVGIIGRNGSAIYTASMVCGTVSPTAGTVRTNGRVAALLDSEPGSTLSLLGEKTYC